MRKFTPVPQLDAGWKSDPTAKPIYPAEKVRGCAQEKGHVLVIEGNKIKCINCPAEWKDEEWRKP